jgi:PH (Pleckstrin Homology) domain-containing protein
MNQETKKYLDPGEHILWEGIPYQGIMFQRGDILAIPFSIFWFGFALFWEGTAIVLGAPFFFLIFGSVFIVIGFYLCIGRFLFDKWRRTKTTYALTDRRVLIVSGLFSPSLDSLNLSSLSDINFSESTNDRGTITFGRPTWLPRGLWVGPYGAQPPAPALERIENAAKVMREIRHAQAQLST